jgi:hypothetical protein
LTGRVSELFRVVQSALDHNGTKVEFATINGLDRETVKDLERFAKASEYEKGYASEVISSQAV